MNRNKKALLRGFADTDLPAVTAKLAAAGYALAQTLAGCDVVVLGPGANEKTVNLARERKVPAIPWSELQLSLPGEPGRPKAATERRPLFQDLGEGRVRVLDQMLRAELPASGLPAADLFTGLCFDEPFLRALRAVARGAAHGFPTALEGPTAASKTTVVLWLGRLLGRSVTRLNLSGQTDTGELVGRFVPMLPGEDWELASLRACEGHLQPLTRELLRQAEGRELTWAERVLIRRAEAIETHQWRFQEGVIPQAMRHGHFVLVDEINLAEPQVLERLNPVLEDPASLLVSEGHHTRFGPGGLPIHPDFRIFATLNPAEYSGRSVMSPAFRDRFTNWHNSEGPGEREYLAHLRLLVRGEQPEVRLEDGIYQAPASQPLYPQLAEAPGIEVLLERLARFHALLAAASVDGGNGQPGLGRSRRERYVFSRRGLLTCLRLWAQADGAADGASVESRLGRALAAIYFERLAPSDRKAARSIASAAGLPAEDFA
jgi:MoxR-like ATPase